MEIAVSRSARHWWVFVLRGAGFFFLAVYLFASPENALVLMGNLFSFVILIAGLIELYHAFQHRHSGNQLGHWVIGVVDIILGTVLLNHVGASIAILRIVLGIYILFRGLSILSFRNAFHNNWLIIVGGIIIFIFGLMVLFNAGFGNMTMITWLAIAFLFTGLMNILLGIRLKP